MIDEWIEAIRTHRGGSLKLAELSYRAFSTPDFDYEALRSELAGRGYDCPEKPALSKYKEAYSYWIVGGHSSETELTRLGLTKGYLLARYLQSSSANPGEWLEKAIGMPRTELVRLISKEPLQEASRTLTMPASLYEQLETGQRRLYSLTDFPGESLLPAVEFCAAWLTQAPDEVLQELWKVLHGES